MGCPHRVLLHIVDRLPERDALGELVVVVPLLPGDQVDLLDDREGELPELDQRDGRLQPLFPRLGLKGTQPEVIRAIFSGSTLYHNPR